MKNFKKIFFIITIFLSSCQNASENNIPNDSNFLISSSVSSNEEQTSVILNDYNPDGSKRLEAPLNQNNKLNFTSLQTFSFVESLPAYFRFIYGNNFATPSFYSENEGGGLRINDVSGPKKGFQTPLFETYESFEFTLKIGKFYNNSKTINETDPIFVIYGFSQEGYLYETINIYSITENSEKTITINNKNVEYLEIRVFNFPYRGQQAYNFQLLGCSFSL